MTTLVPAIPPGGARVVIDPAKVLADVQSTTKAGEQTNVAVVAEEPNKKPFPWPLVAAGVAGVFILWRMIRRG